MTFEDEYQALHSRYFQLVAEAEERCAAKIAAPLDPATTYSSTSPYAAAWDIARKHNREVHANAVLNIEMETLDRVYDVELSALSRRYGVE